MPSLEVKRCRIADLLESANFVSLLESYGVECGNPDIGVARAQIDYYKILDEAGAIHILGAFDGDLIGFIAFKRQFLPHYGSYIAINESWFVDEQARATGAGNELLTCAEAWAKEMGCTAYFVSAGVGSVLERVMSRSKYRPANVAFCKALA